MLKTNPLTSEMVSRLNEEPLISLITINPDTLEVQINAVSWIRADVGLQTIRVVVGHQSECLENIHKGSLVTLGFIDHKGYFMIRGKAMLSDLKKETIKYYVIELKVDKIDNVMFYGGELTQVPDYKKTYDPALAKKIDLEIDRVLSEGWI